MLSKTFRTNESENEVEGGKTSRVMVSKLGGFPRARNSLGMRGKIQARGPFTTLATTDTRFG